jgi:molybdate transport system substrate-binding protein
MRGLACVLSIAFALFAASAAKAQDLLVYAAASLTEALQEVAVAIGQPARFSFAASSTLARQIENGAPADIFASADEEWADYLAARKLLVADSRITLLSNRLVLIVPADRRRDVELSKGMDLASLLDGGRLAVGDPAHVPAGRYTRQSLEWLGAWAAAEPRLARADSVRAAMALVERGEAPFGIVYATDAAANPRVSVAATFPPESHAPVAYPFAILVGRDRPAARAFLVGLRSPAAMAVFRKHGFAID